MTTLLKGWRRGTILLLMGRIIQLLNSFLLSVIVVRQFGLEVMGTFAIGFIAATMLTCFVPLGLPSFLPRVGQAHARSCYAALSLQLGVVLFLLPAVLIYARMQANASDQFLVVLVVALGGAVIGISNTGLVLSIMKDCFYPGLVAPLFEMTGLIAGACIARTPLGLAACHVSGRLFGMLVIWSGFSYNTISFRRLMFIAKRGARYFVPDVLSLLSEQSAPLMLTALISRRELAMFRLCQQILTAADTPGWTFVQSKYPELVIGSKSFLANTRDQVGRLGWAAACACCIGSAALAFFVYHVSLIAQMMAFLSATLFWRYSNNFFDQALRATGHVKSSMWLATAKAAASFAIFLPLVSLFRLWGAVLALCILSVGSGIAYQMVFKNCVPPRLSVSGVNE